MYTHAGRQLGIASQKIILKIACVFVSLKEDIRPVDPYFRERGGGMLIQMNPSVGSSGYLMW